MGMPRKVFPLRGSRRSWSGDCGSAPGGSLDAEGVEHLALALTRPVDGLDVAPGGELVQADRAELARCAARRHRLVGQIGVLHAGGLEVVSHHRLDHRRDDAEAM